MLLVFGAVCCVLFVVPWLPCGVRSVLFIVCCCLFLGRCLLFVVRWLLFGVLFVVCCVLFVLAVCWC